MTTGEVHNTGGPGEIERIYEALKGEGFLWDSIDKTAGQPSHEMKDNTQKAQKGGCGSCLCSLAKGISIFPVALVGGALFGVGVLANGLITAALYLPGITAGAVGGMIGSIFDKLVDENSDDIIVRPMAFIGALGLGGVLGGLGVVVGHALAIPRGVIGGISCLGAGMLSWGLDIDMKDLAQAIKHSVIDFEMLYEGWGPFK